MKKIIVVSILSILFIVTMILIKKDTNIAIWDENALKLSNSFETISGNEAVVTDLTDFTTFEWDALYSFEPYFPKEEIYEIVGYKWSNINETISEGMNQIVFLNDGKVVCYLYGDPDRYKLYFDFGYHKDGYLLLNAKDNTKFTITVKDDIKYLKLVE